MSAEGRVFDIITGRYSNGEPCLSPFLEGHAGDPLRVNRRGRYEYIERPALTIGVCIQPTVLRWIADKPRLRGQGLLARFDYSVPPDLVGYRESEPPATSEEVRTAYDTSLKAMVLSLADWDDPMVLTLTNEARKVIVEYLALIEPRLRPDGDLYGVRDWAAKLAGGTVRKAGLIHIGEHLRDGYREPISEETMRRAIRLGDYYTAHALAAFGAMSTGPTLASRATFSAGSTQTAPANTGPTSRSATRTADFRNAAAMPPPQRRSPELCTCLRSTATSAPCPRRRGRAAGALQPLGTRYAQAHITPGVSIRVERFPLHILAQVRQYVTPSVMVEIPRLDPAVRCARRGQVKITSPLRCNADVDRLTRRRPFPFPPG